jgi:Transcriptional regulator, AbiEi antitoxin
VEEVVGQIARNQHGVVTRAQLLAAGASERAIERRLGKGVLLRVHAGVYRVGHRAPSVEARYLAAVLACGPGAALSGRAAGHLWGLLKGGAPPPEVTAPGQRRVQGVRVRRSRRGALRTTNFRGIPVTTVPQTLADLAAELSEDGLARACHEAGVKHGTTPAQLEPLIAAFPNRPGTTKLRRVMRGDTRVALSKLEARFLKLLRAKGLPLPKTNRIASAKRVDCRWPDHNLTVELDSYTYHSSRHAWEQDRRRERQAFARGDDFRRYTWGDVFERPAGMLAELGGALA